MILWGRQRYSSRRNGFVIEKGGKELMGVGCEHILDRVEDMGCFGRTEFA